MRTFCRGGQLKALMSREGIPEVLNDIKPAFEKSFGTEFRGTLLNDLLVLGAQGELQQPSVWDAKEKATDLLNSTYDRLVECINRRSPSPKFHSFRSPESSSSIPLEPGVQYRHRVQANGVEFATFRKSKGNAQILYRCGQDSGPVFAGQIQDIFVHERSGPNGNAISEYFLAVKKYEELSHDEARFDPYRKYPLLDVRLCHDNLSSEVDVISLDDIVSHFASCPFETDAIEGGLRIVLSLDRVSGVLYIP
jgi:hypothetical protein